MNRKVLAVLTVVIVAVFALSVIAQPPQGGQRAGGRRGRGQGDGFRGKLMKEHIAQCPECAAIAEEIKEAKEELKELNQKIQDHRWEKSLEKLNEFKAQNPDKADDIDKLIQIRKRMKQYQTRIHNLQEKARDLAQQLDIPPEIMRGAFGQQHGPGPSQGFGDRVGEQMGPGPGPGGPGQGFGPRGQEGGPGMGPGMGPEGVGRGPRGRRGSGQGFDREEWRERRMERLEETDPELHDMLTEQKELRDELKEQVDQLTESMMEHILNQVRENTEE